MSASKCIAAVLSLSADEALDGEKRVNVQHATFEPVQIVFDKLLFHVVVHAVRCKLAKDVQVAPIRADIKVLEPAELLRIVDREDFVDSESPARIESPKGFDNAREVLVVERRAYIDVKRPLVDAMQRHCHSTDHDELDLMIVEEL